MIMRRKVAETLRKRCGMGDGIVERKMMRRVVFALAALIVVGGAEAETVKARYVRLTVTASRPAPSQPPFYGGRSWQICD